MTATAVLQRSSDTSGKLRSLPFPTSAGILLGVSLCGHMAAAVNLLFGETLNAATCFAVGQGALAFALIRLYDGAWVLQDIRLQFVGFLFLYGCTLPLISILRDVNPVGLTEAAALFGTAFLGFNLVQWWYKQPWVDVPAESLDWVRPTFANALMVALAFAGVFAYAWMRGTRAFLTLDRSQMSWLYTQTWVVSMMIMNGFAMFMFAGWPRLSRTARRFVVVTLVAFVIFHIGLGNRRDFFAMAMFLAVLIASLRRATIGPRTIAAIVLVFFTMLTLGVIRQLRSSPWLLYNTQRFIVVAEQNEFVMPIKTAMYYATAGKPLRLGETYLAAPSVFVPRAVWPEKPIGLSLQFNRDQFGDAIVPGYAYTPVTEAILNFGFVGPFIVMSLVSLGTVALVRNASRKPLLYFVLASMPMEVNRGTFAGVAYYLVVVGAAIYMMKLVSRIEWVPKPLEEVWPPPSRIARTGSG